MKNPVSSEFGEWSIEISRIPIDRAGYTKGKYPQYYGAGGKPVYSWELYNNRTHQTESGTMRALSTVYVRNWIKKEYARLLSESKQNPGIITPLKALIGKTIKVVMQGGKIIGIPVSSKSRPRKRNAAGFMAGGVFHPIRSSERWTRDKLGSIYMDPDKTPYDEARLTSSKKKAAAAKMAATVAKRKATIAKKKRAAARKGKR